MVKTKTPSDFTEIAEIQLVTRRLRTAAAFVFPWSMSYTALERFLINSKYRREGLQGTEKPAFLLSHRSPFLSNSNLKNMLQAFYRARPLSMLNKKKQGPPSNNTNKNNVRTNNNVNGRKQLQGQNRVIPYIDVC